MIDVPVFRPYLHVQAVPPDRVFLYGEGRQFALSGKSFVAVANLIDGTRSSNEIIETLIGEISATDSAYALLVLEQNRYIEEAPRHLPLADAAFWSALDVPTRAAEQALATHTVWVEALGDDSPAPLLAALEDAGVRSATTPDAASLRIVITDDYLRPELAAINRKAIAGATPWLLAQPNGLSPLVGPLFVPGETACWACLEQRLRANRELEGYLDAVASRDVPRGPRASLAPTRLMAFSVAATQIVRHLVQGRPADAPTVIHALDPVRMEIHDHVVVRRPQCPVCGEPEVASVGRPEPLVVSSVLKTFTRDGGHRSSPPEETLRRYKHHISPISGVVKALVRTSAPDDALQHVYVSGQNLAARYDSYQSLRRNIRGSSSGKGTTDSQAQVSALCEAVERYSGVYRGEEYRVQGSKTSLGEAAIDPRACMLYSERQYAERDAWNARERRLDFIPMPFDPDIAMEWTPVWSMTNADVRYLPTNYLFYSHPTPPESRFCLPDSNGCAAGNTVEEAILQGFMELIERDSVALWWYNRIARPELDLDSVDITYVQQLRQAHARQNRHLWVLDLTADFGIPAFVALSRRTDSDVEDITFAPAAHFDPKIALLRALTELNQMMPGVQKIGHNGSSQYAYDDPEAQHWWGTATIANQPYLAPAAHLPKRRLDDFSVTWSDDLRDDIEQCRSLVEARGLEMLVLNQTRPDIGIPVTKVIVPGLRHFWARYAPGRLYDVPVQMGWLDAPTAEDDLNPITMFI